MAGQEAKKLYRSRKNRMICGVCGGMAEYFEMDPTVMRVLWVLAGLITGGTAVLAYIIACFVIPNAPLGGEGKGAMAGGAGAAPGTGGQRARR